MKKFLAFALCLVIPIAVFAGENAYKVKYDGGSLSDLKTGDDVKLVIDQDKIHFVKNGKEIVLVPASGVTEISYGQDVHRRVGAASVSQ